MKMEFVATGFAAKVVLAARDRFALNALQMIKAFVFLGQVAFAAGHTVAADKPPTWTVLLYGHGDHNLSGSLANDLRKIEQVGSSDTFRIVGQVDFDASRTEDNDEAGLPAELHKGVSRILFMKSSDPEHVTSKPVQRLRELNMDDTAVLRDFLEWGFRTYPADRTAVIFSDHGGQWEGFGGDSQDGTSEDDTGLTPDEIARTTREAMRACGVKELEFLSFDACLMGGIEVLDCFHGVCRSFIACPEIDFGDGWNYAKSLGWLKAHPDAAVAEFGPVEVASWRELHMQDENDDDLLLAAHACYDMTKYPAVREAFCAFAERLASEVSPSNLLLFRTRRLAPEYCIPSGNEQLVPAEYVDLGSLAQAFASAEKTSTALRERATRLGQTIDALIVAKAIGADKPAAKGLSVWYPLLPAQEDCEEEGDEEGEGEAEAEGEGEAEGEEEDDEGADDGEEEAEPVDVGAMKEDFLERFQRYRKLPLFVHSPWPRYLERVMKASEDLPEDELEVRPAFRQKDLSVRETLRLPVTVKDSPTAFLLHGTLFAKQGKNTYLSYGEVVTKPLCGAERVTLEWKPSLIHAVGRGGKGVPLAFYPVDAAGEFRTAWAKVRPARKKAKSLDIRLIVQVKGDRVRLVNVLQDEDDLSPVPVRLRKGMRLTAEYPTEIRKGRDPDKWQEGSQKSKQAIVLTADGDAGLSFGFRPLAAGGYRLQLDVEDVAARYGSPAEVVLKVGK